MKEVQCVVRLMALCGEGPLWSSHDGVLYWIDCLKPAIYRFDPVSGRNARLDAELPEQIYGLARRQQGGFLVVGSDGLSILGSHGTSRCLLGDPEQDNPATLANDGKCDPHGRFWFGTGDVGESQAVGSLYRLDPDGTFHKADSGFVVANGPAFTEDGHTMYFADSGAATIYVYDVDPQTGNLGERRIFARVGESEGVPDGMTVDSEGCLLSAHFDGGRVTRYRPDGSIERVIELPVPITTSCAFGGVHYETLFVTTGSVDFPVDWEAVRAVEDAVPSAGPVPGGLYAIECGITGFALPGFAG